ncbi:MAG: hypothetical protein QM775_20990 [Pirellulales bacterium]
MLVVGGREMEEGTVSIRDRIDGDVGALPIAGAIAKFQEEVRTKRIRQVAKPMGAATTAPAAEANEY